MSVRILADPAYDYRDYFMYHDLVFWRIVQPWHRIWEDWIATRLFGFISDMGRKKDQCRGAFLPLWTAP